MNKIYQKPFPGAKNAGFTLIELLVVVLIIGILSSVALPQYTKAVNKSRGAEARLAARAVRDAQSVYFLANEHYNADLSGLDIEMPELKYFTLSVGCGGDFACTRASGRNCAVNFTSKRGDDAVLRLVFDSGSDGKQGYLYCAGADCSQYFSCGGDKHGHPCSIE